MTASYDALEKAQEILDRAVQGGSFDDLSDGFAWKDPTSAKARAEKILGEEFDDVEVSPAAWLTLRAVPGFHYSPQGRKRFAAWLPEEGT